MYQLHQNNVLISIALCTKISLNRISDNDMQTQYVTMTSGLTIPNNYGPGTENDPAFCQGDWLSAT